MPSVASSHTRSSRSKAKPKAALPAAAARALYKPDPKMAALFRDEVKTMLAGTPAVPASLALDRKSVEIVVNTAFERRSTTGMQESLHMCTAVDKYGKKESWVTRTEGDRQYFPRIAQVKKRLRDEDDVGEEHAEGAAAEQQKDEQATPPRKISKKRASGSSSSARRDAAPAAPKKTRRAHAAAVDDEDGGSDLDDGATTETEASHLARTRAGPSSGAILGEDVRGGKRRFSARLRRDETEDSVKREPDGDDLASLCGRVDGLEFRNTVEPDTDVDLPGPSTSRLRSGRF
ncbi:hypothetical protein JCM10450v2_007576 [Rhodotorula kratochvilovae]